MELEVGAVVEGRVTGITKFGAFVTLRDGRSGLVHISEVANTFVSDIGAHLQVGQPVKVRVMSVTPDGKLNLSIKRAEPAPRPPRPEGPRPPRPYDTPRRESGSPEPRREHDRPLPPRDSRPEAAPPRPQMPPQGQVAPPTGNRDFEDRLQRFMKESDSRIADNRMYADHPRRGNRRGK